MHFVLNDALMALLGGLLIGVSSAIYLLGLGRIAGITGIFGGLLRGPRHRVENVVFLIGLVGAPLVYAALAGAPDIGITHEAWALVAGGLAVGIGTRMGGGCTSGHGVCGMSRLSVRSIVATVTFMALGLAMATLLRPVLGL